MATTHTFETTTGAKTYDEIVAANASLSTARQTARETAASAAVARDEAGGIGLTEM